MMIQSKHAQPIALTFTDPSRRLPVRSRSQPPHRGISLMEVIFAMAVLLTGLLGLAAILGVATNNARDSLSGDRAAQIEINRQGELGRIIRSRIQGGTMNVLMGQSSRAAFEDTTSPDFRQRYPQRTVDVSDPTQATYLEAFCVDPWFLTAADTIRPDNGAMPEDDVNAYDRSVFPCYDDRYSPLGSPAAPMSTFPATISPTAIRWSMTAPVVPDTAISNRVFRRNYGLRRLPRVSLDAIRSPLLNQALATAGDGIQTIDAPEGSDAPPGLFVKRSNASRSTTDLRGRYSTMLTVKVRGFDGTNVQTTINVVTFQDRQIATDPIGSFVTRQNLTPYVAADGTEENTPIAARTFSDEICGYVTDVASTFRNLRGTFTYAVHRSCDPAVSPGDWMMLIRREYSRRTMASGSYPVAGELLFDWFQVVSVDSEPTLDTTTNTFQTTVTVTGPNWTVHPIQNYNPVSGSGPYPPLNSPRLVAPAGNNPDPVGYVGPGQYSYSAVNGNPSMGNEGHTGTQGDPLYGTTVVLMKNVVNVRRFQ